jgi:3-polyprenyl-4-hydroxybenzoate decarboxylase
MAHQYVGFGRVTGSDEVMRTNVVLSEEELDALLEVIDKGCTYNRLYTYRQADPCKSDIKGYEKLKKAHANLKAARLQREALARAQEERDEELRRLEALHRTAMKDVGCHGQLKGCPWNNDQLEQLRSEGWDLVRKT